jgi:hypothetical protein
MRKTSQKLRTLKLSRETLRALSSSKLSAVAGGLTWRCGGTADCTDSCGCTPDTLACDFSRLEDCSVTC